MALVNKLHDEIKLPVRKIDDVLDIGAEPVKCLDELQFADQFMLDGVLHDLEHIFGLYRHIRILIKPGNLGRVDDRNPLIVVHIVFHGLH